MSTDGLSPGAIAIRQGLTDTPYGAARGAPRREIRVSRMNADHAAGNSRVYSNASIGFEDRSLSP